MVRFARGHWTFEGKTVAGCHRVGGCSGCDVVRGLARREKILCNGTLIVLVVQHIVVTVSAMPVSI